MSDHGIDALLAELAAKEAAANAGVDPLPFSFDDEVDNDIQEAKGNPVGAHGKLLAVAAVNALPALRGEVERLRAELARAREERDGWKAMHGKHCGTAYCDARDEWEKTNG